METIEPHLLVWLGVGTEDKRAADCNDVDEVLQIMQVALVVFQNQFFPFWVCSHSFPYLLVIKREKLMFRRLGIAED